MVREYETPSGRLRHAAWRTAEEPPGWPVQPECVMLIEDYNVARATHHPVSQPGDVAAIKHCSCRPTPKQRQWFADRMAKMKAFADQKGLFTQAWSAFGIDAAVWLTGTQGAVMMAMDAPEAFGQLIDLIGETDYARTELAAATDGVDMVCQRGWYSSTDFWSPRLFDTYVYPHLAELTARGPSARQEVRLRDDHGRGAAGAETGRCRRGRALLRRSRCWTASRWRKRSNCLATG